MLYARSDPVRVRVPLPVAVEALPVGRSFAPDRVTVNDDCAWAATAAQITMMELRSVFIGSSLGRGWFDWLTANAFSVRLLKRNSPPESLAMSVPTHMGLVSVEVPGSKQPCLTGWPPFFSESSKD